MPLLPLLLLETYALCYHASPVLQLGCPRDTNCSHRTSFSSAASAREPSFSRRQCYQPTFPILLTYPPPYLRLTIPPVSPSSHTRTFYFCTQPFYPISWTAFLKTLYSTFSPSSMLCVFLFYFPSFPHFPIHSIYFFIFLHISHAGYLTQSLEPRWPYIFLRSWRRSKEKRMQIIPMLKVGTR